MNKPIENFLKEVIYYYEFSSNTISGFSCYIPDPKPSLYREGLLLWVCNTKRKRIESKAERLISFARKKRMKSLGISEQDFNNIYVPNIVNYLDILSNKFGFQKIGNGISLNVTHRIYNRALSFSIFETNLNLLRDFEIYLTRNPITLFAEAKGILNIKRNKNLLFDQYY